MHVFCVDMRGVEAGSLRRTGRSSRTGSAFGMSLLDFAVRRLYGIELPEVEEDDHGKPFFHKRPDIFFSVSHSRTHALCAISDLPLGADIETRRLLLPGAENRLMNHGEREQFDFFELWVLRESVYKLTQQGDLRKMPFERGVGGVIAPVPGVNCRLYGEIEGCAAALASYASDFPDTVKIVAPELICS